MMLYTGRIHNTLHTRRPSKQRPDLNKLHIPIQILSHIPFSQPPMAPLLPQGSLLMKNQKWRDTYLRKMQK